MRFLQLTPLNADFLPEIVQLDQDCFGGLWSPEAYQRELDSPNSVLLGLVQSEEARQAQSDPAPDGPDSSHSRLFAMGCLWSVCEEAHVTLLAVHKLHRRQGMGQALLGHLLQWGQQRGLEWATLEVRVSNTAALGVYRTFGFAPVGRRRRYYADTGEDALVLWRNGLQELDFQPLLQRVMQQATVRLQQNGWSIQPEPTYSSPEND